MVEKRSAQDVRLEAAGSFQCNFIDTVSVTVWAGESVLSDPETPEQDWPRTGHTPS